jgi:hypothetical protein
MIFNNLSGMKDDLAFIEHILFCIDKIQGYTKGPDW